MNWTLLQNSVLVGGLVTVISVSLGFISALWLGGLPRRPRAAYLVAAILALALPPFLVTNCWLHFLGHTGVWHRWVPLNIFSLGGTIWILSLLLWPLTLLFVWGAWQRLEPCQLESDLLVRGWAFFCVLLFPLARGALVQASLITFVLALNNFAVPAILQVKVFPAEMWIRFNTSFDTLGAWQLSWPLAVGPMLLVIWLSRKEVPWPHRQSSISGRLFRRQLGTGWYWLCGACSLLVCVCSIVLPLFQILSLPRTWSELPGALAAGQSAIWNSFWYAAAAATVVVGISIWAVTRLETRRPMSKIRGKPVDQNPNRDHSFQLYPKAWLAFGVRLRALAFRILAALPWLTFFLPGVLVGIGFIVAFNHTWTVRFYRSGGIVVLAFVVRYLVIGWYGVCWAGQRVDRDLIDAARVDGATRWQMARHVMWPQIVRAVGASWYVIFLLCLWDVESMILVVPPGGETLALRIFNLLHYGHNAQVNALCLTLLGVALVPLVLHCVYWAWKQTAGSSAHKLALWSANSRAATYGVLLLAALALLTLASCSPSAEDLRLRSQIFSGAQVIGSRGVGVGQLNKPRSIAVDKADNLYVVDMTGRVQKFSPSGTFVLSWQMPQTDLGKPKGMCRDREGNILVLEPHYSRVNMFTPTGKLLVQWGSHGTNEGQLSLPRAVTVNSRSQVFVSEYQEAERVQIFSLDRFDSNAIGVDAPTSGRTPSAPPQWLGEFGKAGTGPGEFNRPEGICVDAEDRVYVADSCNHRIQVFSSLGRFLRSYGKPGKGLGELSYPYDICVDAAGRQYVCEFGNSRIQVFDAHDQPIEIIGGPGAEPGRFSNPWSVALDSAGNLYVADSQNHRVQKLVRKP